MKPFIDNKTPFFTLIIDIFVSKHTHRPSLIQTSVKERQKRGPISPQFIFYVSEGTNIKNFLNLVVSTAI